MSQPFKSLEGRRILINRPERKESAITLTPEVERQMEAELMKKWTRLEVFAVGADVTRVVAGDIVLIPGGALTSAELVEIDDQVKLMVSDYDIAIVW